MNVITLGSFDVLHPGHLHLFEECARIAALPGMRPGRMVTVAVNTSEFIGRFKAAPIQSLHDRVAMVKAIRWVNQVQVNDGTDQAGLILAADADVIVIGDDWAPPRDYLGQLSITHEWLWSHSIDIRYIQRVGGLSSTGLKQLIRAS